MAYIGVGGTLTTSDGSGNPPWAGLVKVSLPTTEVSQIEHNTLDITDGYKKFVPGLKDPGAFEFEITFTDANALRVEALLGVTEEWVYTAAQAGTTYTYDAFLTGRTAEIQANEVMILKVTGKVTGGVVVA